MPTLTDRDLKTRLKEAERRAALEAEGEPDQDRDQAAEPGPIQLDEPVIETPEPQPPLPGAKFIGGAWLVKRGLETYRCRPAMLGEGDHKKPAPSSIYDKREGGQILDPITPLCDDPGRLLHALAGSGARLVAVDLHGDAEVDREVQQLRELGLPLMADLLRERHPQGERKPYGSLDMGAAQASRSLERFGPSAARDDLKRFLTRHAQGDFGEFGRLADVELTAEQREFPGAFSIGIQNAVSIGRAYGVVRSCYGPEELDLPGGPQWRDDRRLHVATVIGGGAPQTYIWSNHDSINTH